MQTVDTLVDLRNAQVRSDAYASDEVYQQELERIFRRCWLYVGHESQMPNNGDYVTTYMGEDAVIVCRDNGGRIRVLLNRCRHRANKVCLFDKGNASVFTCTYHGWSYSNIGALTGVPFQEQVYFNDLEREQLGLIEVPKVASYGGLIFANWDAGAQSLDRYLGDVRWYLDNFLTVEFMGGLEVIPGTHKYFMPVNWKLLAENFAGDTYHFRVTHASVVKLLTKGQTAARLDSAPGRESTGHQFTVAANYGSGAPHGLIEVATGQAVYARDLAQAAELGSEVVEWVREKHRRTQERVRAADPERAMYGFHVGNIFPNFSLIGPGSALYARGLIVWHPRGASRTEAWQWCAVEKDAPRALKERQIYVLMHRQAATGLVAPDDHENFERMTENLETHPPTDPRLHYRMGLGHEEQFPDQKAWQALGYPGFVAPQYSEINQREVYRYWSTLMADEGASR